MCISVQKKHSGTQCGTQSGAQFSPKAPVKISRIIPFWGYAPLRILGGEIFLIQ